MEASRSLRVDFFVQRGRISTGSPFNKYRLSNSLCQSPEVCTETKIALRELTTKRGTAQKWRITTNGNNSELVLSA